MNKVKPEVKMKDLSWEKPKIYICDSKNCDKEGKYKAPKSKINLKKYYFFCLKHIKEYNKSWDYYKGMTVDEIELSLRQDVIWNRQTWPTNVSSKKIVNILNDNIYNKFQFYLNNKKIEKNFKNSYIQFDYTYDEKKSIEKLGIKFPITIDKIKSSYKKLVKKYHPDINKSDKNAEKHFKEINSAYKLLLKKFLIKKN